MKEEYKIISEIIDILGKYDKKGYRALSLLTILQNSIIEEELERNDYTPTEDKDYNNKRIIDIN